MMTAIWTLVLCQQKSVAKRGHNVTLMCCVYESFGTRLHAIIIGTPFRNRPSQAFPALL